MRAHPGSDPRNIGDVRTALLRFLARQRELALAYDLPNPPTIVDLIRERLADETCTILILGEANKGKSTFANAIVGRPGLIPEGIDRHTSQAFRVRLAEREAYRVRYEDDSSEMLTRDELSTIGTQSLTGEGTFGHDGRIVRYIEIDIAPDPARPLPLPPEVVLIDTPGLGTLNAAHAQVTQRFLPLADAVIFVLDSDAPVLTPELEIIATVLETTSHILFVQTKLGDAGEAKWRENQRRNEEILTGRFGAQLGKIAVWPIDSLVLQQALARGNKGMERASHFPEFLAAFKRFLDRAVMWGRCVNAALAARPYQDYGDAQLAQRLQDFDLVGAGDHAQALADLERRRAVFLADWGEAGRKRGELLAKVANDTSAASSRMRLALEDPHLSNPAPDHMSVPPVLCARRSRRSKP
ncbi:MAG: dynamin family protein [Chloroflexia bacterium]